MENCLDPRFLKGIDECGRGLYFECHQTQKAIRVEEDGEDRELYQGIIQIPAGYLKREQGVLLGVASG